MTSVVEISKLVRVYSTRWGVFRAQTRTVTALAGVDLTVHGGEVLGLLGPNGAGKTTLVKVLSTMLSPTSGSVRVFGHDVEARPDQVRPRLGLVLGGDRGLYWRLTARDNLLYFADMYGVSLADQRRRIPELLALAGLEDRADDLVERFSRGMKQRLHIARALVHDPDLLVLDEPTAGLDPRAADGMRKLIAGLSDQGKTILLATHYLYEADALCDRIVIISKGRIMLEGVPSDLKDRICKRTVLDVTVQGLDDGGIDRLRLLPGVGRVTVDSRAGAEIISIHCEAEAPPGSTLVSTLAPAQVLYVSPRTTSLEDVYLQVVSGEA